MAYTTIDDPSAYFHVRLYTGTGSSNSVTNNANAGDFKPDWIWIKNRTDDAGHPVFDSSRGVNKNLTVNVTDAEATVTTQVTAFGSNGFTVGSNNGANGSSDNLVAWQWKANGGTTTDGSSSDSVSTSNYQANTTAGFSIVTYTGNATAGATVAHGLGAVPKWIIVKDRDAAKNWVNYHQSIGNDRSIALNTTDAQTASTDHWHNTTPTSSVFYLGNYSHVNANSDKYVAYCFAEIQGYSKFGSYTGNGSTNGPFVYTGFKPAWVMVKKSGSGTAAHWRISDSTRSTFNPADHQLSPSSSGAEFNENDMDLLSNGFKIRQSSVYPNESAVQFIYMAFAENPFVSSEGVPTTAR
jgi:hypothetical protein